ncbi:MAG: class I SAM-dependent methyltransferase [Desulfarculus sp.]|nr:class I SAM-dependent methyltransferase [Desulfarculus sp.]
MAQALALRYPSGHWLRGGDPRGVLEAYAQQQAKAYSRVKNRFIVELLGDLAGKSFLDYGCGPGQFLLHALRAGAPRVVGVDAEVTALAAAKLLLAGQESEVDCQLICARQWPFSSSAAGFDVILLKDVIEHLPDDQGLLQQAVRLLGPRGRLVISTQNAWSLNYLIEGFAQRRLLGRHHWQGWDPTHLRFYTPPGLERLLARAGLEATAWRSSYLVPHKLPRGGGRYLRLEFLTRLDELLGWRRPLDRLGWCLMVQARPTGGGRHS